MSETLTEFNTTEMTYNATDEDTGSECSENEQDVESFDPIENMDILTDDDKKRIQESAENIKVLEAKLASIREKIATLRNTLAAHRNKYPSLFPRLTERDWKTKYSAICARHDAHLKSQNALDMALKPIKAEIAEKKAEVAKKSKMRDREPNYDIPTITWLEERLAKTMTEKPVVPPVSKDEYNFMYYYDTYHAYTSDYLDKIGRVENSTNRKLAPLVEKSNECVQCMTEDRWLGKYLVYARRHGLPTSDDLIFKVCNEHYLDRHADGHEFDCPCYADPTSEDELEYRYGESRDYFPHVWSGGRCNRGTKMYLKVDTLPIGFIECKDPLNYCRPTRW
jgi:hypothetical protein